MKPVTLLLLLVLSLSAAAAEIRPGDVLSEVNATLGPPRGQLRVGDRQLLYYERGEVELQAGAVSRVALLSIDEYAALEARRAAAAVRIREEQEIRRQQLTAAGERLRMQKLADPAFRSTPLKSQVAFWEDFSRRYPDVPCAEHLVSARLLLAEQVEANRAKDEQAERVAELEARVHDSEARIAQAEAGRYRVRTIAYYGAYAWHPGQRRAFECRDSGHFLSGPAGSDELGFRTDCREGPSERGRGHNSARKDDTRPGRDPVDRAGGEPNHRRDRSNEIRDETVSIGTPSDRYPNQVSLRFLQANSDVKNFPYRLTDRY